VNATTPAEIAKIATTVPNATRAYFRATDIFGGVVSVVTTSPVN
jgi:hypothetical protein